MEAVSVPPLLLRFLAMNQITKTLPVHTSRHQQPCLSQASDLPG